MVRDHRAGWSRKVGNATLRDHWAKMVHPEMPSPLAGVPSRLVAIMTTGASDPKELALADRQRWLSGLPPATARLT